MSERPFDGFEVHLVGELAVPGTDDHFCETIDTYAEYEEIHEEAHSLYYTVYGHRGWGDDPVHMLPDGGAEAIADFDTYQPAIELARALADGKRVADCVPEGLEEIGL